MTDDDIDQAIARAIGQLGRAGLDDLTALRARLEAERDARDPALGRVWDALARLARRDGDAIDDQLAFGEGRARWLSAARGAGHPDTIEAWLELGETADLEAAWDVASRAWQAIIDAADAGTPALREGLSRALRGLGGRRLAAGRLDEARALFERDLALTEQRHPAAHPQLAVSLANLALAVERAGDRDRACALRERERAVLIASGGAPSQLEPVDAHLARLRAG